MAQKSVSLFSAIFYCAASAVAGAAGMNIYETSLASSTESHLVDNFINENRLGDRFQRRFEDIVRKRPTKQELGSLMIDAMAEVKEREKFVAALMRDERETVLAEAAARVLFFSRAKGNIQGISNQVREVLASFGPCGAVGALKKTSIGLMANCADGRWSTPPAVVVYPELRNQKGAFDPVIFQAGKASSTSTAVQ